MMFRWLLVLFFLALPVRAAEPACLKYEPAIVSLEGAVIYRGFTDAAARPERPLLLLLDEPICVERSGHEFNVDEGDVIVVQLNAAEAAGRLPDEKALTGRRLIAKGTLYHRHTAHHHAQLVLMVSDFTIVKQTR